MRKTTLILSAIVAVCAWFAWVAYQPAPQRPKVAISFLGYTNEAAGKRFARIAVTNLGVSKIFVYLPEIEVPAPAQPGGLASCYPGGTNQWQRFHAMLGRGASGSFLIFPPTNQSPWRLSFFVYNDFGAAEVVKRVFRGRHTPFEIQSDWIEPGH